MTAPALPFPLIWCQQKWGSCQELAMALKSWHIWARQHALVSCGVRFRQKTGVGIRRTSWFGLKYLLWSPQSQMKKKIVAFFCQKKNAWNIPRSPERTPGLLPCLCGWKYHWCSYRHALMWLCTMLVCNNTTYIFSTNWCDSQLLISWEIQCERDVPRLQQVSTFNVSVAAETLTNIVFLWAVICQILAVRLWSRFRSVPEVSPSGV